MLGCGPGQLGGGANEATQDEDEPDPLTYRLGIHLPGLEEDVTVYKTPAAVWAERASGELVEYHELRSLDREVYRARFGMLPRELLDELSAAEADARFPIGIFYENPTVEALSWLPNSDDRIAAVPAAIQRDAAPALRAVEDTGIVTTYVAKYAPIIAAEGTAARILALAKDERVAWVYDDRPQPIAEVEMSLLHAVKHHRIDTTYDQPTANGQYAENQKIGVVEAWWYAEQGQDQFSCGLNEPHAAFSESTVTYNTPPTKCNPNNNNGCPVSQYCSSCIHMGYTGSLKGHCTSDHTTTVTSVISNTESAGIPYGAAKAEIFIPNHASPCLGSGSSASIYDWLVNQGVNTANASYVSQCDGFTTDAFVRNNDLFIARGAGNFANSDDANSRQACRRDVNSLCVGATNKDFEISCFSNWENPDLPSGGDDPPDREEPDVVFVGGEAGTNCSGFGSQDNQIRAAHWTNSGWIGRVGTSWAAPTATALAAHLRESCGDSKGWTERALRAIMRTGAHEVNPHSTRYSMANSSPRIDYKDGAGWVSATQVEKFCGSGDQAAGEGVFDLPNGDGTTVDGRTGYDPNNPPEFQRGEGADPITWRAYTDPADGSRVWHLIREFPQVSQGKRIRVTISWDACPGGGTVAEPARDIDLFLLRVTSVNGQHLAGIWETGSQSVYDANEGFDFEVKTTGAYAILAGWVPGTGCSGSSSEPFGWAWTVF